MATMSDKEFEAQMDLETLVRANEIERDPARVNRAREFADRKKEEFGKIAEGLRGKPKSFNGAVKGSRMQR